MPRLAENKLSLSLPLLIGCDCGCHKRATFFYLVFFIAPSLHPNRPLQIATGSISLLIYSSRLCMIISFLLYWSKPRCHVMLLQLDNVQYFKQFSLRVIMWDYPAPGWRMIVMMILIFSLKQYAVETVKWYMDVYFDIYIYIYSENLLMFYIIHQTKTTNIWFPGSQNWLFVYVIIIYIWCFGLWVSQNKQFEDTVFDLEMD